MKGVMLLALAANVSACSPDSASSQAAAQRESTFAELKRSGFAPGERQIVGLTNPTETPRGGIAEGSPIFGFSMTKGTEIYECRVPDDLIAEERLPETEMAKWVCMEEKRG